MNKLWELIEIPAGRPVVIACPGPGALEGIARIPENAYVIACNYGVCLPLPRVDEWMVLDEACLHAPWWEQAFMRPACSGSQMVMSEELRDDLIVTAFLEGGGVRPDAPMLVTAQGPALSYTDPFPVYGALRGNSTVAGGAAQRAYWGARSSTNARELPPLYWLGVPLRGGEYFDRLAGYNRLEWPYVATLNALVRVLEAAGMHSIALSETALEMERGF